MDHHIICNYRALKELVTLDEKQKNQVTKSLSVTPKPLKHKFFFCLTHTNTQMHTHTNACAHTRTPPHRN